MALDEKFAYKLAVEYIWDYYDYVEYPNTYHSQIINDWKTDFNRLDSEDKKTLYLKINERLKLCVDNEYYEHAAIIRDALKNI